jgi:signal peptidase II
MTTKFSEQHGILWILIVIAVIALDQITKLLVLNHLPLNQPIAIAPNLNLLFAFNTGAAFSFLGSAGGWQNFLFIGIAVIVSIVLVHWLWKINSQHVLLQSSLSLILGGTLGNLYDRIMHHHVIDFIDIFLRSKHWPTFNIADTAISVGAALLCLYILSLKSEKAEE